MKKEALQNTSKPLETKMLPARFELATFRLGGERSIQLSYGSKIIIDFRFWILDCPISSIITN